MKKNSKGKINNMELLEAMSGIRECYVKEADFYNAENDVLIRPVWRAVAAFVAMIALSILLPNLNATTAHAMQNLPVVGAYFKMVTFREYHFENESHKADVSVKGIESMTQDTDSAVEKQAEQSANEINVDMTEKTDALVEEFQKQVARQGYSSLDVSSSVITDSEVYYCVELSTFVTQADGFEINIYYTIEKKSGKVLALSDLFQDNADYVEVISDNIKSQMRQNEKQDPNKIYFLNSDDLTECGFKEIDENQQFYINKEGQLVICFAEADVAPAYMGALEFVIPNEVIADIRK